MLRIHNYDVVSLVFLRFVVSFFYFSINLLPTPTIIHDMLQLLNNSISAHSLRSMVFDQLFQYHSIVKI